MDLLNIMVLLSINNPAGPAQDPWPPPSQNQAGPAQDPWQMSIYKLCNFEVHFAFIFVG